MIDYPKFWQSYKKALVLTHAHPDADAIGSSVGMFLYLQSIGLNTDLFIKDGIPAGLRFIAQGIDILDDGKRLRTEAYDLIVVNDCGSIQMADVEKISGLAGDPRLVNIDHHPSNENWGGINIVYPDFSSTSEIIYDILKQEEYKITPFLATALLSGLAGDTGSFRHSNTTPKALKIAGELLYCGAKLNVIQRHLFGQRNPQQLKGWSFAFGKASYDDKNKALVAAVSAEDIKQMALDDEAFEGVVEVLNTVPEARFAAFLRQQGDKVKVSLRSEDYKNFAVNEFARKFGGGGHKLAAGFTVKGILREENGVWYIEPR